MSADPPYANYRRLQYLRSINLLEFGDVRPNQDSRMVLQAAIDSAKGTRGLIIDIPPSEADVLSAHPNGKCGLWVPRTPRIIFRGSGPSVSAIYGGGALRPDQPLIMYSDGDEPVTEHEWHDLFIGRGNEGSVFEHAASGVGWQRFIGCIFKRVHFQSVDKTHINCRIEGMLGGRFEEVTFQGGLIGMDIQGSHVRCSGIRSTLNEAQTNGVRFRVGNSALGGVRIESCLGGYGVLVEGSNIVFTGGPWFEGKKTKEQLVIGPGSFDLTFMGVAIADPIIADAIGIKIGPNAGNIRFLGGELAINTGMYPGWRATSLESGVFGVSFDGIIGASSYSRNPLVAGQHYIDPGAHDISYKIYGGIPPFNQRSKLAFTKVAQVFSLEAGGGLQVSESDGAVMALTAPASLTNLIGGYDGQIWPIQTQNDNLTIAQTGNIKLKAPGDFAVPSFGAVILMFDQERAKWEEIGRTS